MSFFFSEGSWGYRTTGDHEATTTGGAGLSLGMITVNQAVTHGIISSHFLQRSCSPYNQQPPRGIQNRWTKQLQSLVKPSPAYFLYDPYNVVLNARA